jgi:RNA polymerase sigma factor (sigma-70 family)
MYNPFKEQHDEEMKDRDFIERSLQGDTAALESLILRHQSWIYNITLNMVGDFHDAQDITQEVLIKVITKLSTYEPEKAAFRTWLYRIVINHILSAKENNKEKFFAGFIEQSENDDWIERVPDRRKTAQPGHAIIANETKISCILCTLLCLSRRERIVFILGALFDVTDRVGAEICGVSRENFRKIVSRTRQKIYDFFDKNCSLIHENNPCTCGAQSKSLISAGMVDPKNLILDQGSYGTIREITGKTISELEGSYYEFNALFNNQPFLKGPDMVQWLREALKKSNVENLFLTN